MLTEKDIHKVSQILRILLKGETVELDGRKWIIDEDEGRLHFMCEAFMHTGENGKPLGESQNVWLKSDASLTAFIQLASRISEDEWIRLCFQGMIERSRGKDKG